MVESGTTTTLKWITGWMLVIILFSLITRTRVGYVLVYYSLVLLLIGSLLTQYKWVAETLGFIRLQPI